MDRQQGKYALIQFSGAPERHEYVNIGVIVATKNFEKFIVRFGDSRRRISRLFGPQSKMLLDAVQMNFEHRIHSEMRFTSEVNGFEEFVRRRSNSVRVSAFMPLAFTDFEREAEALVAELVDDRPKKTRKPRIQSELKQKFATLGVAHLLEDPEPVKLPEFDITLDAKFGYQNGHYNLIDGARLSGEPSDRLQAAGKLAFEGNLLWKHYGQGPRAKRLVVVGDFEGQTRSFYEEVRDQMERSNVVLYRLDDMHPLQADIERSVLPH
ncbi:DUF3037 domain-containing protein [Hyphobacterium sp. CCMP332]|uniref:DUF3037 domain-containing protein n=1 Tax=Hyphobacterium sp. CCMP332 TaxID=2749086 RepID=UPI0016505B2A|nr:DUF3037 domain-containing protein [Hyphobacterium sp. CCMP332]QNL18862.1 DUF3037 domain-containing protein [Hyphobacterium sp. CCMP332]